jgi:hypothetical protein
MYHPTTAEHLGHMTFMADAVFQIGFDGVKGQLL